jgi:hypothetical protein
MRLNDIKLSWRRAESQAGGRYVGALEQQALPSRLRLLAIYRKGLADGVGKGIYLLME